MKKIEEQMCDAVKMVAMNTINAWSVDNTAVSVSDDGVEVRLHGNLIAKFHVPTYTKQITGWQWSLAGWNTVTTRSRINALARRFGGLGVTKQRGQAYAVLSDGSVRREISSVGWIDATLTAASGGFADNPDWTEARTRAFADGRRYPF